MAISAEAMTKLGMPRPSSPNVCPATSRAPLGAGRGGHADGDADDRADERGEDGQLDRHRQRGPICSDTGRPLVTEIPKLPVNTLRSHDQN